MRFLLKLRKLCIQTATPNFQKKSIRSAGKTQSNHILELCLRCMDPRNGSLKPQLKTHKCSLEEKRGVARAPEGGDGGKDAGGRHGGERDGREDGLHEPEDEPAYCPRRPHRVRHPHSLRGGIWVAVRLWRRRLHGVGVHRRPAKPHRHLRPSSRVWEILEAANGEDWRRRSSRGMLEHEGSFFLWVPFFFLGGHRNFQLQRNLRNVAYFSVKII
jgi:hypothetical protein